MGGAFNPSLQNGLLKRRKKSGNRLFCKTSRVPGPEITECPVRTGLLLRQVRAGGGQQGNPAREPGVLGIWSSGWYHGACLPSLKTVLPIPKMSPPCLRRKSRETAARGTLTPSGHFAPSQGHMAPALASDLGACPTLLSWVPLFPDLGSVPEPSGEPNPSRGC